MPTTASTRPTAGSIATWTSDREHIGEIVTIETNVRNATGSIDELAVIDCADGYVARVWLDNLTAWA